MAIQIEIERRIEDPEQVLEASTVIFLRTAALKIPGIAEALMVNEEGEAFQRRRAQGFKEAETLFDLGTTARELLADEGFNEYFDEWRNNFEQSMIDFGSRSLEEVGPEMIKELAAVQRLGETWLRGHESQLELSSSR